MLIAPSISISVLVSVSDLASSPGSVGSGFDEAGEDAAPLPAPPPRPLLHAPPPRPLLSHNLAKNPASPAPDIDCDAPAAA
jgi:hypothetical protein